MTPGTIAGVHSVQSVENSTENELVDTETAVSSPGVNGGWYSRDFVRHSTPTLFWFRLNAIHLESLSGLYRNPMAFIYVSIYAAASFNECRAGWFVPEGSKREEVLSRRWEASTEALLGSLSDDYDELTSALSDAESRFRRSLIKRLEPALNSKLKERPHGTYEQKKSLAKWSNDELRRFDLAIKCPKTGEPSLLLVMTGKHPEIGRFVIEHKDDEGKRIRSVTSVELPEIELMEAGPRREALREWRQKTQGERGGELER